MEGAHAMTARTRAMAEEEARQGAPGSGQALQGQHAGEGGGDEYLSCSDDGGTEGARQPRGTRAGGTSAESDEDDWLGGGFSPCAGRGDQESCRRECNNMRFQLHRFKHLHRRFVPTFQTLLVPNSWPALVFVDLLGLRGEKDKRSFADEVLDLDRDATARAQQAEGCKSEEELAAIAFQLGVRAVDYIELTLVGPNARSDKGLYESALEHAGTAGNVEATFAPVIAAVREVEPIVETAALVENMHAVLLASDVDAVVYGGNCVLEWLRSPGGRRTVGSFHDQRLTVTGGSGLEGPALEIYRSVTQARDVLQRLSGNGGWRVFSARQAVCLAVLEAAEEVAVSGAKFFRAGSADSATVVADIKSKRGRETLGSVWTEPLGDVASEVEDEAIDQLVAGAKGECEHETLGGVWVEPLGDEGSVVDERGELTDEVRVSLENFLRLARASPARSEQVDEVDGQLDAQRADEPYVYDGATLAESVAPACEVVDW